MRTLLSTSVGAVLGAVAGALLAVAAAAVRNSDACSSIGQQLDGCRRLDLQAWGLAGGLIGAAAGALLGAVVGVVLELRASRRALQLDEGRRV